MTQPRENPPPHNPQSPLDELGDIGLTFADGLPGGPLTDEQKAVDYSVFSPEEIAMMTAGTLEPIAAAAARNVDSTTGEEHTGAMIALIPSGDDKFRMTLPDGEPADQLHTTLQFLGDAVDITPEARDELTQALRALAENTDVVHANGFAISMFNPMSDDACWVIELGEVDPANPELQNIHTAVADRIASIAGLNVPEQHSPWRPHVTVIYDASTDWAFELRDMGGPVTYDTLRLAMGGENIDFPLRRPSLDDDTTLYSTATEHGGVAMTYHAARRPEAPASAPWAVVRDSDGFILTCTESRSDAERLIDTVRQYEARGGTVAFVGGHITFSGLATETVPPSEDTVPAEGDDTITETDETAQTGSWEGILALEGTPTGDGRQFSTGALTWADLPIPLLWQKQVIGEGHLGQVTAGVITEIWRNGAEIRGRGTFDLNGSDGAEAYRQVREGFLKGLSIDPDSITDADIEYVYPESDGEDEMLDLFGPMPEMTIFHAGRIRATTLVQIPAFAEAELWLTDGQQVELAVAPPVTGTGDETHYAAYTDGTWDAPANQARLARVITPETAASAYAYVTANRNEFGQVSRGANYFLHHEINAQGQPGPANLTAVAAAIAALNADATLSDEIRTQSYAHLAKHLRAAGLVPMPLTTVTTLTAASHTIVIEDVPPADWFEEPTDVPSYGALTVTDQGRVYGFLAPAKVPHRSFSDRKVFVPMGNVDYSRFMGRETIVAGGGRVTTGPITMSCGHASTDPRIDGNAALEHYDNSCSIVASVRVGENENGVWVAGALLPGVDSDDVARMMSCQLSGDWRPTTRGRYELAGALLVPVPGFPMARTRPSVRVTDEGQLVASAVPVRFVRGDEHRDNPLHAVAQRVARGIGRDAQSRVAAQLARIHGR